MTALAATHLEARTASPEDTRALAAALAMLLEPGDVVLLVGDLGAGKTTFTQGLAAGLGVAEQVTSPTFTLVRPYACGAGAGAGTGTSTGASAGAVRTLHHADLYRLDHLQEVVDLGLGELVEEQAVAVVEWGDVGEPVLGRHAITVTLAAPGTRAGDDSDTARVVTLALPPGRDPGAWRDHLARWMVG